jgi:hypothetical protein
VLVEMNKLLTAADVQRMCNIPDELFRKLLPELPVALRIGAVTYYLKSDINKFLKRVLSRLADEEDRAIAPDRVRLGGKVYSDLGSYEWRLLRHLLRAKDRASEFTDVVDHVYGHDAADKDEALRQLAKNLNKKLTEQGCPLSVRFRKSHVYLR